MASPQTLEQNSLFSNRAIADSYAPQTPSPLSPYSMSSSSEAPIPAALPLNSHYYRPPRSSLTSPTRSNISSPAGSPTRTSRQTRIQSLLANDPLLSRLTPLTISRLSNDPDLAFTPAEKEWSHRAAEGIVKVGEWLREVEGWNLEWRRAGGAKGKEGGVGYLPPLQDRPKKRRKVSIGTREMGSIKEEVETESEDEGVTKRLLRRSLIDRSMDTSDNEEERNGARRGSVQSKASVESLNGRQSRKPLTPYQLKLQKQKAGVNEESTAAKVAPISTPAKKVDRPIHEEYDGESTDDDDEGVEYWGSLKRTTIEHYLARVEFIKSEIEELDVEALKSKVLSYRTGITNPLTDSSAIITAITLQLLPPLHRLTKLLSAWAVRLAVLRIVPVFLRWLQIAKDALDAGYTAINHPSISPSRLSSPGDSSWRGLEEETYTLMQETITQKVATAGKLMDTMLDALEGREDVLPDIWITELEDVEERVGAWEMDGERVVLEGRLRLEELRQRESRREEQEREQEKTLLIMEQERFAEEARGAESVIESVMEHAEETERGLREAMEANEDIAEGIELVGDEDEEGSGAEDETEPREINELLMRLEDVEQERLFSREASDSETEGLEHIDEELIDTDSTSTLGGSYIDVLPAQHMVPMPHHELSLGSTIQPDIDTASTAFHTPMPTPYIAQEEIASADRKVSDATDYYTPMPTPGMTHHRSESSTGSITPTQFHTPMPTPLMPPFQQEQPVLRRQSSTPFHTPMPTPSLMTAFQQGPPMLRRQPSMPFIPVPKLPPTAQVFTTTARREPPSPETPKTPKSPPVEKEVKKTSPGILAAARYFFKAAKEEDTKEARAKKEEEARKEEARKREEEEREMIAAVDAETERLAKLEEVEKERAAKVKAVRERLAEAEKMREKERAVREIEEKKKVAEAERKRLVEEEERQKKAELEAARIKAKEEESRKAEEARLKAEEEEEEAERLRRASIERVDSLEAASLATEAEHQRILAEEASIIAEEFRQAMAEDEEERRRIIEERIAAKEAETELERQREIEIKEEAERQRFTVLEAARVKTEAEAEAEQKRVSEEEEERQHQAEIRKLEALKAARIAEAEQELQAATEAARVKAEKEEAEYQRQDETLENARLAAEAEHLRLAEEEAQRQAEIDRTEAAQHKAEAGQKQLAEEEQQRLAEVENIATTEVARVKAEEEGRQHQVENEGLEALGTTRLAAEAEYLKPNEEEAEQQAENDMIEAKAEAERLRLIEEEEERERQVEAQKVTAAEAAQAERRRAALEESEAKRQIEVQKLAALATARLLAEEEQRKQAEIEKHAALEATQLRAEAEAEAERLRLIKEEAEQQRQVEIERLADVEAAHVKAEEERVRLAEEEERQHQAEVERAALEVSRLKAEAEVEAERLRTIDEEATLIKAEAEALAECRRLAEEEAEEQRNAELERLAAIEADRQSSLKATRDAEIERQRLIEEEAEERRQDDIQCIAEQEAELQRIMKLEDDRRMAVEEEARHNAEVHAEAIRRAEEEVSRQREAEYERIAAIEKAHVAREESERQRMAKLEDERLKAIEQEAENKQRIAQEAEHLKMIEEAEKQRLAALEAARLEAEAEAERQRIIEQEKKAEVERLAAIAAAKEVDRQRIVEEAKRQEEQKIAKAQKAETERLAALEVTRLAVEAEVEAERQRDIEDEKIRKEIAEKQAKWLAEEEEEAKRQRDIDEELINRKIAEEEARWEAEEEEDRRMVAQLQKEAMEAIANAEKEQEEKEEEIRQLIATAEQERMDSEDEAELQMIAQIRKAALEADAEQHRQQAIEEEEQKRIITYEARCVAEQEAEEKRVEEEIERERLREFQQEQRWEAEEQAERKRISAEVAAIEAEEAAEEIRKVKQEEEIHRRIAAQERRWIADEETEQQNFTETESEAKPDLTFEDLDRQRRLAEDERQRLADLDLLRRERERLEAQEAERLKMEAGIEEARIKAEQLREEEEEERKKQAQFSNHQGSNSEGGSISGDDITEDYQDVSSLVQPTPLQEVDEDSGSESMAYAEARKNQPSVPPPSVSMTPITSRSSSALGGMKYTTPEMTKEDSSVPWSSDSSGLGVTPEVSKLQGDISDASSSDLDENLVAAENLAAHNSLQQVLNDSVEYELPRDMQSSDHDMSESSFGGMPSILVAPSTPQNESDVDDSKNTPRTIWDHAVNSPVFEDDDSSPSSFVDRSFPSDMNMDENDYPQLSMEDYEPEEEYSDFDMVPLETSTPKHKRRPGMLGGLDSITEVLTPNSPRDEYFRPSDNNAFGTPSKKTGKSGELVFPGFSTQDSPTSRRHSFNNQPKITPISLNLGIGKQTVSSQNKAVKRGTTPEPKAPVKAQRSQKFSRKAPLDMTRPRSLSSTGHYSSTAKPAPKAAPQKATLGPGIRAIRRPHMEIDSDDEGSVASEQRWSRSKENTPDLHSSPPELGTVPRLNVNKRHIQKPSNLTSQVTPDKSKRLYQPKSSQDGEISDTSQSIPQTPRLEFPQISLDDKVNEILTSLPSPVRLTASNLQKLSETTNKRQPPLRPFELLTPSSIPAPRSVGSSSMVSDTTSFTRGGRRHNPSFPSDIKVYDLHRSDGQSPIKLYIRLVGERGERVMVRVGGGWADLAEYLKEYATHHGSKRRVVSGNGIEIQDLGGPHHHSLHPSRSITSLRSNSPAPGNSRSNSPNAGSRSRSVSAIGLRSRSNSALGARPGSSSGNRPGSSAGNRPGSSAGNRPGSSMGVRGRERSSSLLQSPPITSPPSVMRGGHDGTSKERPNLTPFQPLMYQKPSGLSPPGGPSPPVGSRPPSRGQSAIRPPSRPGSSHSTVGGIRRSASRLSFSESAFDVSETASSTDAPPPKPLGLAGPKGKNVAISPENQAWVEGMIGEVRKVSAHRRRRLTGGSNNGDMGLGDEPFIIPGDMVEVQPATTGQQFGGRLEITDMGKEGGTRRVFPKKM